MKFYKETDNCLINLDLVKKVARKDNNWYVYYIGEQEGEYIMPCMASEIKKIVFSKSEEKEVKKVSLICDRCGKPFKYNVLFDKNGVSVNTIKTPLLCSDCICGDSKNE